MVKSGNLLYFLGMNTVAYDPRTDTWYGPVSAQGGTHNIGTSAGLWVGSRLIYFNNADVIAAAKVAGRVMTTEQWKKRKQQFIESAPLLDRAKFAFGMKQFDAAKQHLTKVLKSAPNNAEALLLMGYLHDTWCTNKPDKAARYYRRLEGLKDNPSASMSGMWMRFHLHKRRKEYAQAYQLTKEIPKRFGRLEDHARREMTYWGNRLKKELAKETRK
jgi:tetratricopeptide (TPR) repeat protein